MNMLWNGMLTTCMASEFISYFVIQFGIAQCMRKLWNYMLIACMASEFI